LGQPTSFTIRGRTEANGTVTADSTWTVEYDSTGQPRSTTDPEGNVREYVYNRLGRLVKYTDPKNHETRYEVDAAGNLTKITDPLGDFETFTYDRVNNLTAVADLRNNTTLMAYDEMNRRTQVTSPLAGVYRVQYNGQGLPVLETDEDGRSSRAEFDALRRLTKEVDPAGNVIEYSYDIPDGSAAGSVGALQEPTEVRFPTFTQRQRFDQRERLTNQTLLNPTALGTEGLVDGVTRDRAGRLLTVTDANGKTRSYAYDALGQTIETTDSLGKKAFALYDARGNLIRITDANGNASNFKYDRLDRLVEEVLPLGQRTTYKYDASSNLSEKVDANGNVSAFEYDELDRLAEIRRSKGGVLTRTTHFTWDNAQNLTSWSDVDHTRPAGQQTVSGSATYDENNNKTSETMNYPTPNGGTYSLTYSYTYSAAGYKTSLTWADGTTISYAYAGQGALESVTIPGEGTISVNQFKWLAPEKITLPGGTSQVRTFDGLLNIESLKVRSPSQQSILEFVNTYGKMQELKSTSRVDTAGGVSTTNARSFTYDNEIRLTQAVSEGSFGTETESFTLDAMGNRIAHSKVAGAWTYDANNRLKQRGTGANAVTYDYDDAGNLIRKSEGARVTRYFYDALNRLIEVRDGDTNVIARYGYDLLDARVWKEQYRDVTGAPLAQPKRTYYLYSDEGLIGESEQAILVGDDGAVTVNTAVNGGVPTITTQYAPRPDEDFTTATLFTKTVNSNGQTVFAYFHHDELGTPLTASDRNGQIVWAASYDVFGRASIVTPAATLERPTINSNLRLPGQYADAETGLHYNYRRYYDPAIGRYVTQDPIGFAGGDNLYRYADADPVNQSDPTGECPACYVACFAACMLEDAATNAITGECNNFGDSAKSCALSCAVGMGLGRLWKWGKKLWDRIPCAINSFPADTVVHVKPAGSSAQRALLGETELKPISQIALGDEVLAYADWKEPGAEGQDARFSYEPVSDIFTSYREQQLVHLTLESGGELTATEGHPFLTPDGWRDALLLERGSKVLLKSNPQAAEQAAAAERWATVREVRIETKVLPVFNLQVANAHTYFTGVEGVLNHNHANSKKCKKFQYLYEIFNKRTGKTQKYGVTSTPPRQNGNLPRPQSQLGPNEDYRIKDTATNRKDILQKERDAVQDYRDQNNGKRPPRQKRP
jgi:RHS repeat-associated protein